MDRFTAFLQQVEKTNTLRKLCPVTQKTGATIVSEGDTLLDFSSNDYLGLSRHPQIVAAARDALAKHGAGAGAARLMSGDFVLHHQLEHALAGLKKTEAALLFGSGYLANIGVLPALAGRGDAIFADRLVHASIIDGCRLSGATLYRFRHNDCRHLADLLAQKRKQHGRALIVTESIFSMDGDKAPLAELCRIKKRHDCLLMVDEAHALGVVGATGGGCIEEAGCTSDVDIAMATLGKALGSYGAFVAVSNTIKQYLVNRARSFIFATALPPPAVAAALAALRHIHADSDPRVRLADNIRVFTRELAARGIDVGDGQTQIIPLHVGESDAAIALADSLRSEGIHATAIRPPTVPQHTARIRLSITSLFGPDELVRTAAIISRLLPTKTRHDG